MIAALDSLRPPTAAQVAAAYAAGVRLWSLYLASTPFDGKPAFNLARPSSDAEFEIVKACGGIPIGYCSGWDDPLKVKAKAARLGIRPGLDVEGGIRGYGPWTQPWLDASGAGLYGNLATHAACRAPWRVLYGYYLNPDGSVRDPGTTWHGPPPAEPHGYQFWNSHSEFGVTVDRNWMDDWFGPKPQPQEEDMSYFMVPDSNPEGIIWLCRDLAMGPKRRVFNPAEGTAYAAVMTDKTTHTIPRFVFDAMPIETVAAIQPAVADVKATVVALPTVKGVQGDPGPPGPPPAAGTTFTAKIGG